MTKKKRIEREKQAWAEAVGHVGQARQDVAMALHRLQFANRDKRPARVALQLAERALCMVYEESEP
jgi:hypothetical protein